MKFSPGRYSAEGFSGSQAALDANWFAIFCIKLHHQRWKYHSNARALDMDGILLLNCSLTRYTNPMDAAHYYPSQVGTQEIHIARAMGLRKINRKRTLTKCSTMQGPEGGGPPGYSTLQPRNEPSHKFAYFSRWSFISKSETHILVVPQPSPSPHDYFLFLEIIYKSNIDIYYIIYVPQPSPSPKDCSTFRWKISPSSIKRYITYQNIIYLFLLIQMYVQ